MYKIWFSSESFAEFVIDNTVLGDIDDEEINWSKIYKSDLNNPKEFHKIPDHIKEILYLDAPDLIVEENGEPILSIEISSESGTGHNVFQRFGRIAAAVENEVPTLYIYPREKYVTRQNGKRWDKLNPIIFKALENVMRIYDFPALLFYFPNIYPEIPETGDGLRYDDDYEGCPDKNEEEIQSFFEIVSHIVEHGRDYNQNIKILNHRLIQKRLDWMQEQFVERGGYEREWSPITSTTEVSTESLISYLSEFAPNNYEFSEFLLSREKTIIYQVNAKLRGDPYAGNLVGIDFLKTRIGKTCEDRDVNLVIAWGPLNYDEDNQNISVTNDNSEGIDSFIEEVSKVNDNFILDHDKFSDIDSENIPRYYMQIRHGTKYSLKKMIRMFGHYADAILFGDGALWREG